MSSTTFRDTWVSRSIFNLVEQLPLWFLIFSIIIRLNIVPTISVHLDKYLNSAADSPHLISGLQAWFLIIFAEIVFAFCSIANAKLWIDKEYRWASIVSVVVLLAGVFHGYHLYLHATQYVIAEYGATPAHIFFQFFGLLAVFCSELSGFLMFSSKKATDKVADTADSPKTNHYRLTNSYLGNGQEDLWTDNFINRTPSDKRRTLQDKFEILKINLPDTKQSIARKNEKVLIDNGKEVKISDIKSSIRTYERRMREMVEKGKKATSAQLISIARYEWLLEAHDRMKNDDTMTVFNWDLPSESNGHQVKKMY